jgi:aspartate kinase
MKKRHLVVQKFGGTSVGSVARIHHVATLALAEQRSGKDVVVVVSAMSGETNRLLALADEVHETGDKRERDSLAAAGEQVSAALTAIAIQAAGGKSRSFLGHQIRIITDSVFSEANVLEVEPQLLRESLDRGEIPVVAGFQGIDKDGRITTLGRGGSDTTAVAVAAALKADVCDIYTDVDGVYTADPNMVPSARKLAQVPYQHMLTFANLGAKVLHDRSVAVAKKYGVTVQVRTSFGDTPGTMIVPDEATESRVLIGGLACDKKQLMLTGAKDVCRSGTANTINEHLQKSGIQPLNCLDKDHTLFVRDTDMPLVRKALASQKFPILCVEPVARISMVGSRLSEDDRIQVKAASLLKGFGKQVKRSTADHDCISYYVAIEDAAEVMRILHDGMGIGVGEEHGNSRKKDGLARRRI